jgi:hypothetical protein
VTSATLPFGSMSLEVVEQTQSLFTAGNILWRISAART